MDLRIYKSQSIYIQVCDRETTPNPMKTIGQVERIGASGIDMSTPMDKIHLLLCMLIFFPLEFIPQLMQWQKINFENDHQNIYEMAKNRKGTLIIYYN